MAAKKFDQWREVYQSQMKEVFETKDFDEIPFLEINNLLGDLIEEEIPKQSDPKTKDLLKLIWGFLSENSEYITSAQYLVHGLILDFYIANKKLKESSKHDMSPLIKRLDEFPNHFLQDKIADYINSIAIAKKSETVSPWMFYSVLTEEFINDNFRKMIFIDFVLKNKLKKAFGEI